MEYKIDQIEEQIRDCIREILNLTEIFKNSVGSSQNWQSMLDKLHIQNVQLEKLKELETHYWSDKWLDLLTDDNCVKSKTDEEKLPKKDCTYFSTPSVKPLEEKDIVVKENFIEDDLYFAKRVYHNLIRNKELTSPLYYPASQVGVFIQLLVKINTVAFYIEFMDDSPHTVKIHFVPKIKSNRKHRITPSVVFPRKDFDVGYNL